MPASSDNKPRLVIVGGGWAGFEIVHNIDYKKYHVTIISPRRNTTYTPLLASAATGLFSFSLAEEPIRSKARSQLHYIKASVTDIDFKSQNCTCQPAFNASSPGGDEEINDKSFRVSYDMLVIAPGMQPTDFGTPGVKEHGHFMSNVSDAMRLRKSLFDLLEKASLPTVTSKRRKELLHIAIVGGGPTGVELVAELDDLFKHELHGTYPDIAQDLSLSLYDVAPNILPMYEAKLHEYASKQLESRKINVSPDTKIEKVDAHALHIKDHGRVGYGLLVWATGNTHTDLIEDLQDNFVFREKGPKRILTDPWLRVLTPNPEDHESSSSDNDDDDDQDDEKKPPPKSTRHHKSHPNVFSLGDCADIQSTSLPPTAEVAVQKARYLTRVLNHNNSSNSHTFSSSSTKPAKNDPPPSHPKFKYKSKQLVSYIGQQDGVVMNENSDDDNDDDDDDSKKDKKGGENAHWTGAGAWVAWRGANVMWVRSWRSRVAILFAWLLNWLFGREVSRI